MFSASNSCLSYNFLPMCPNISTCTSRDIGPFADSLVFSNAVVTSATLGNLTPGLDLIFSRVSEVPKSGEPSTHGIAIDEVLAVFTREQLNPFLRVKKRRALRFKLQVSICCSCGLTLPSLLYDLDERDVANFHKFKIGTDLLLSCPFRMERMLWRLPWYGPWVPLTLYRVAIINIQHLW